MPRVAVPVDCWGWLVLASSVDGTGNLSNSDAVALEDGRTLAKLQLIQEALQCDPGECAAWTALGNHLGVNDAPVTMPHDGRPYSKRTAYAMAIEVAGKNGAAAELGASVTAHHNLALILADDDEVMITVKGKSAPRSRVQLLVDAIALDPDNATLWCTLGSLAEKLDRVALADGRQLTSAQIYVEALQRDPDLAAAYFGLASVLPDNGFAVVDGRRMTKKAIYVEAIRCNPQCWETYSNLASAMQSWEVLTLKDRSTVTQKQLYAEALRCAPKPSATLLVQLAATLVGDETIRTPFGSKSIRGLLLQALQLEPTLAMAYNNLACSLRPSESVDLPDGRTMDRKALLAEAVRCAPDYADAWFNTALALPATMAKQRREAIEQALRCDPQHAGALLSLALSLPDVATTVPVPPDLKRMNKAALLRRVLQIDPKCTAAYVHLAATLQASSEDAVVVLEGEAPLTRADLLSRALQTDPTNGQLMAALAHALVGGQKFLLADKRLVDKKTLYVEALRSKYESSAVYVNLGLLLEPGESVNLGLSRTNMTSKLLFIEAIRCNTTNARAYFHLAGDPSLAPRQSKSSTDATPTRPVVTLADLRKMDCVGLYCEALRHDPTLAAAYNNLGVIIGPGGTVDLGGGKRTGMTQKALFEEALRYDPGDEAAQTNLLSLSALLARP